MTITCYIVDDEFHAIEVLAELIGKTPGLELIGSHVDPLEALKELSERPAPDLIFLDIDMPELPGMEFADLVKFSSTVIFTTSYPQYAVEAFSKAVFDYLVKPITYDRFLKSITRLRNDFSLRHNAPKGEAEFFYVKTDTKGKMARIAYDDIIYIEALQNYVQIFLTAEKQIAYLTITELQELLPVNRFSRVHKSFIVHHSAIKYLEPGQVRLSQGNVIPLGRVFKPAFLDKMNPLLLKSYRDV